MTAEGQLQCSFLAIFSACSAPPRDVEVPNAYGLPVAVPFKSPVHFRFQRLRKTRAPDAVARSAKVSSVTDLGFDPCASPLPKQRRAIGTQEHPQAVDAKTRAEREPK